MSWETVNLYARHVCKPASVSQEFFVIIAADYSCIER